MEELTNPLANWCEEIKTYHIPRWDELPDFDLYMDQVITYIEKALQLPLGNESSKIITPAMINNYVKLKLMPSPHKKKYAKQHIAYLIAITFLKQVITISEIRDGIAHTFAYYGASKSYDLFCEQQETSLQLWMSGTNESLDIPWDNEDQLVGLAIRMATIALASKLLAEKAIRMQKEAHKERIMVTPERRHHESK